MPPEEATVKAANDSTSTTKPENQAMHFDHLSVVSEETLSNPEMQLAQQTPEHHLMICTPDLNSSQSTLPSLVGPLTPLTPVEQVANQLNDLQAMVPPLSYFENILSQHMGANTGKTVNIVCPNVRLICIYTNIFCLFAVLTPTPELGTSSSTTTGNTMKHTNGWDYNLQSPFSQRKYSNTSSPSRSPPPPPPPLTTFVPTSTLQTMPKIALNVPTTNGAGGGGIIETVAITTNGTQQALNSPKHFFAPIKPRLKLNTELANRGQDALPPGSPPPPMEPATPLREPPDIFVNNALASPYKRPGPRLSPQVSPRHRTRSHCQLHHSQPCQAHVHQQRQRHCQQLQPPLPLPGEPAPQHCSLHRAVVNVAAAVGLGVGGPEANACGGSVVDIYTAALAAAASAAAAQAALASAPPTPLTLIRSVEPVYATAQKDCHSSCISALTKPVMTATTNTTKTTASPLRQPAKLTACAASCKTIPAVVSTASIVDIGSQVRGHSAGDHPPDIGL